MGREKGRDKPQTEQAASSEAAREEGGVRGSGNGRSPPSEAATAQEAANGAAGQEEGQSAGGAGSDALSQYSISLTREVPAEDLLGLVAAVGWAPRDPEATARALRGSHLVCSAYYAPPGDPPGGDGASPPPEQLVAFTRAVSDTVLNGVLWDVAVHPKHQGKGLGKEVVTRVVKELLRSGVTIIGLYAENKGISFYEELGFEADVDGVRGMFYWPKSARRR